MGMATDKYYINDKKSSHEIFVHIQFTARHSSYAAKADRRCEINILLKGCHNWKLLDLKLNEEEAL